MTQTDPEKIQTFMSQFIKKDELDEICIVMYKQTKQARMLGLDPKAQLVCFTKKPNDDQTVLGIH
jgi:hypothetical protein